MRRQNSSSRNSPNFGSDTYTSSRRRYESFYTTKSYDYQTPTPLRPPSSLDSILNNQSSTDYRGGSYTYQTRRGNTTVSRGVSRQTSINGQTIQSPTLWYNRTWHWSTNRTRGYDADLDGTTLPPIEAEEEFWDGSDLRRPPFDDRHPFGRKIQNLKTFSKNYHFIILIYIIFKI